MDNPKLFTTSSTELNKGDQIYLFSDGFADQFGGDQGKKIMRKRFKELLISSKTDSMEDQKTDLGTHFERWKGDLEQIDDVCVMGIRI
jgi:serine phosphatase RsbU (regulator of sigma subunit)